MAEQQAQQRHARKSESLAVSEHLKGCPAERTESYKLRRPNGDEVGMVRCIDCGAQDIVERDGSRHAVDPPPAYTGT